MRKRRHLNPAPLFAAPLFALAGIAALSSAAFAQQPGQGSPGGPADQPAPSSSTGAAASQSGASRASQSGGIPLKLMDTLIIVYPSIRVDLQHNDNIYSTPNNMKSDQILVLIPALRLETRRGGSTLSLRMSSTIGEYQNNKSDNYSNTNVNGVVDLDLGTRLRARITADYIDGVDPRGSTNNPLSNTPDHYRSTSGRGLFSYGAQGARGRLDFELGHMRREYLNNRETTAASDSAVDDLGATFFWRVGPKTTLLVQGKHSNIDYMLSNSTLDSTENTLLAGATWEATAKTSGTFRIGMTKKDFRDAAHDSETTVTWMGQARWSPRSYSHVDLTFNHTPAETSGGVGDFIVRSLPILRWTHEWNSRLTTVASASYATDAYQGASRTDNTQDYALTATYKMRRWLSLGGNYTYTNRNSDDSNFAYKRNLFMLFLHATL